LACRFQSAPSVLGLDDLETLPLERVPRHNAAVGIVVNDKNETPHVVFPGA
jgi:hypothetical protein